MYLRPTLPRYKLRYIEKGRFDRMGGITGCVLCVHDINISVERIEDSL